MKLRVLGCSGSIGGRQQRTTLFLVDDDILIDAGTGAGDLEIAELAKIDHVFLTHSHLDHIVCLPFILDTVGELRDKPLRVYATAETRRIIEAHIFNWVIWPDFATIPSVDAPFLQFQTIALGETIELAGRRITVLPAEHTVPAVGYQLDSGTGSLVFTGDTTSNDALWDVVNRIANLRYLIIETAFANKDALLAQLSRHLCPETLALELRKLERDAEVFVTHLKPAQAAETTQEIAQCRSRFSLQILQHDRLFEF